MKLLLNYVIITLNEKLLTLYKENKYKSLLNDKYSKNVNCNPYEKFMLHFFIFIHTLNITDDYIVWEC